MKGYAISFFVDNVKDGEGNLQMRVRWDGNKVGVNLGYKIDVGKWDADKQRCVPNTTHGRKKITASEINREIRRYEDMAQIVFEEIPRSELDAKTYRERLRLALGKKPVEESLSPLACDVIGRKILELRLEGEYAEQYYDTMDSVAKAFRSLYPLLRLDEMNDDVLKEFVAAQVKKGLKNRTIRHYCMMLKNLLKRCGLKLTYTPRLKNVQRTVVWLSWDELMTLYHAPLPSYPTERQAKRAELARDLLCLSCFSGLRYSDMDGLKMSDDTGTHIRRTIIKTGEVVYIETNKYTRAILDKYRGCHAVKALPHLDKNLGNRVIKELCEKMGFDSPVNMVSYNGTKRVEEACPKYELMSFHCGRRTFIVNALSLGIPPSVVMRWTGHKSYDEMRPYIDITDRAKASAMDLFNK